jgi:Mor family transcriptional regulator
MKRVIKMVESNNKDLSSEKVVGSKSERMKQLYDAGFTVAEISKKLSCHYSFVYGVIQKHCDGVIPASQKESKSDLFRTMYDGGSSIGDIAKETNSNYSYVFSVIKKHREKK